MAGQLVASYTVSENKTGLSIIDRRTVQSKGIIDHCSLTHHLRDTRAKNFEINDKAAHHPKDFRIPGKLTCDTNRKSNRRVQFAGYDSIYHYRFEYALLVFPPRRVSLRIFQDFLCPSSYTLAPLSRMLSQSERSGNALAHSLNSLR